jgi:pilus assembly protein CpaE
MQPLTIITLGHNAEALEEVREAFVGSGRARLIADSPGPNQLIADVLRLRPSAAVIILESDNLEKDFVLIKQLAVACPETAIITAARDASPTLILGSLRAGAREFIQLPIIAEEFRTVIDRVVEFCSTVGNSSKRNGRIIAVFSGKGGAGVSFIGTNLAAAMPVSTLLVDLNLQAGDAASFLGIETKYSLTDFVQNLARLDDSLMTSLVTTHSANLALLPAPFEAHEAEDIRPQDVSEVLHLLGQRYECIVLDLPHTFDPVTVAALDLADDILLVMTIDIPGIRSTQRALKVFDRLDYPRQKVHVVVNRWSKNIDVQLQKVEAHLGERLIGFVPNDYRKVMDSINLGRPLVHGDPSSKITAEIKRIAGLVAGNRQPTPRSPRKKLLGGVFSRQSPASPLDVSKMLEDMS